MIAREGPEERVLQRLMARVQTGDGALRDLWRQLLQALLAECLQCRGEPGDVRLLGTVEDRLQLLSWLQPVGIADGMLVVDARPRGRLTIPAECGFRSLSIMVDSELVLSGSPLRVHITR